jgi:transcriptional/translational regulatory protein YebC/TACO1
MNKFNQSIHSDSKFVLIDDGNVTLNTAHLSKVVHEKNSLIFMFEKLNNFQITLEYVSSDEKALSAKLLKDFEDVQNKTGA